MMTVPVTDTFRRPLHDLRISVTDRCNFRCTYCMPKEVFGRDYHFLPASQLLSFEEIARLARIFVALGVEKIRLTGGEPLVRRDPRHRSSDRRHDCRKCGSIAHEIQRGQHRNRQRRPGG